MIHSRGYRLWRLALAVLLAAFLAGCQVELHQGLDEDEANLIWSTLLKRGIEAEKKSRGKNGFTITVDQADLVRSLEILRLGGLPREKYQSLGQVFSGQGMIASPVEEQARLAFAISQELAATFSRIDGVLTARAHVVLGQHDQVSGVTTPPSASIFLRHTPDSPVTNLVGLVKEMSAKAVPGLEYEKVSVLLLPVRDDVVVPLGPRAVSPWARFLPSLLAAGAGALLAVGGFLAYTRGPWRRPKDKK